MSLAVGWVTLPSYSLPECQELTAPLFLTFLQAIGGFLPWGAVDWVSLEVCCLVVCTRGEGPTLRALVGALVGVVAALLRRNRQQY